jgi:hypothetical protein
MSPASLCVGLRASWNLAESVFKDGIHTPMCTQLIRMKSEPELSVENRKSSTKSTPYNNIIAEGYTCRSAHREGKKRTPHQKTIWKHERNHNIRATYVVDSETTVFEMMTTVFNM